MFCRLIPTEIEAGSARPPGGLSRVCPPSDRFKHHLRIYLSSGRFIFNLASAQPIEGCSTLHFLRGSQVILI